MDAAGDRARPPVTASGPSRLAIAGAAVVIVIGLVLRFWTRSHLWLDEALTVNIARLPLRDIPAALRRDGAPPLYYFLLHGWMRVFGASDIAVRALSGVFAVATLPLMWIAGRRLVPAAQGSDANVTGLVAVLLLASSPFAVRYATETRMYSLVVFLTLLGFLALTSALASVRPGWRQLLPLTVLSGLLLLSHYWSLYLLAAVGVVLAAKVIWGRAEERTACVRALLAIAAGFAFLLPWLPSLLFQLRHTGTPWAVPASFSAMVNAIGEFAGGRSSSGRALALTFFALAGFGLFGAALDRRRVEIDLRTRPGGRGLALTVAGTLAIAITIGLTTNAAFAARYAAVVFPLFLLLVTLGTTVLVDRKLLAGVVAAAVVFGLGTSTGNVNTDRTQAAQLAATIRTQLKPGDVIGYCPDQLGPAMTRVLPSSALGGVEQITFPRRTGPAFVNWVDYGKSNAAADPVAYAEFLDHAAGPSHTVWMVWDGGYRTLDNTCEQINARLTELRPNANQLREADTQHFFEHANLTRYLPS